MRRGSPGCESTEEADRFAHDRLGSLRHVKDIIMLVPPDRREGRARRWPNRMAVVGNSIAADDVPMRRLVKNLLGARVSPFVRDAEKQARTGRFRI